MASAVVDAVDRFEREPSALTNGVPDASVGTRHTKRAGALILRGVVGIVGQQPGGR